MPGNESACTGQPSEAEKSHPNRPSQEADPVSRTLRGLGFCPPCTPAHSTPKAGPSSSLQPDFAYESVVDPSPRTGWRQNAIAKFKESLEQLPRPSGLQEVNLLSQFLNLLPLIVVFSLPLADLGCLPLNSLFTCLDDNFALAYLLLPPIQSLLLRADCCLQFALYPVSFLQKRIGIVH
jgi:hypothetical protein